MFAKVQLRSINCRLRNNRPKEGYQWKSNGRVPFGMFCFNNTLSYQYTLPNISIFHRRFCTLNHERTENNHQHIGDSIEKRETKEKVFTQTPEVALLLNSLENGDRNKIEELVEQMKQQIIEATVEGEKKSLRRYLPQYTFASVMKTLTYYLRTGEYQKFLSFYNLLSEHITFESKDYNLMLVEILSREGETQKSIQFKHSIRVQQSTEDQFSATNFVLDKLFNDISTKSVILNPRTYTSILTYIIRTQRDMVKAKYVFKLMLNSGITPDLWALNTVLIGHVQTNQLDLAYQIYQYIIKIGMTPPHKTILLLISSFTRIGKFQEVNELLRDITKFHYSLTSDAYAPILSLYFKQGEIEKAKGLMEYLSSKNIKLDHIAYSAMINGYIKLDQLSKAQEIIQEMKKNNIEIPQLVQTNLMEGYLRVGNKTRAMEIFDQIQNPDVVSYTLLISGLLGSGDIFNAENLYHIMIEKNTLPNQKTFEVILNNFIKLKNYDKARFYLNQAHQYNISLDSKILSAIPSDDI